MLKIIAIPGKIPTSDSEFLKQMWFKKMTNVISVCGFYRDVLFSHLVATEGVKITMAAGLSDSTTKPFDNSNFLTKKKA